MAAKRSAAVVRASVDLHPAHQNWSIKAQHTTTRRFRLAEHGWMNSCLESPSFCSLTFAPLTSNTLQLFISPPTLAASVLCKSLSHRRPDWCSSGRVSDGETGCISGGETSIILSLPPHPPLHLPSSCTCLPLQTLMCLFHWCSHLQLCCSRKSSVSLIFLKAVTHMQITESSLPRFSRGSELLISIL